MSDNCRWQQPMTFYRSCTICKVPDTEVPINQWTGKCQDCMRIECEQNDTTM